MLDILETVFTGIIDTLPWQVVVVVLVLCVAFWLFIGHPGWT